MPKQKSGLHKGISTIFNGVPIPKGNDGVQPSSTATTEAPTYGPPSHLTKSTAEVPTPIKPESKEAPTEKPKPKAKEQIAAPVHEVISRGQPEWLEHILQSIKDKLFEPKPGVSPARQKAMVVLVPVLFIGMVLAFFKVLGSSPDKTVASNTFNPSGAIAAATNNITWQAPPPYPKDLRDPMKLGAVESATADPGQTGDIVIKGILYSVENPSAIIGIDIVHVGSTVSGATITKINEDSVEFEMNGKKWTQKVR
jgi:hypothetical protein